MRIYVSKPKNGTVDVRLDDSRGLTGQRVRRIQVKREEFHKVVGDILVAWEGARSSMIATRKG